MPFSEAAQYSRSSHAQELVIYEAFHKQKGEALVNFFAARLPQVSLASSKICFQRDTYANFSKA